MFAKQSTPSNRTEQHNNPLLTTPIKIGENPIASTMGDLCYELEAASPPGWTFETIVVDGKEHDRWTDSMALDGPKVYDHCMHFEPRHACHTAVPDLYKPQWLMSNKASNAPSVILLSLYYNRTTDTTYFENPVKAHLVGKYIVNEGASLILPPSWTSQLETHSHFQP